MEQRCHLWSVWLTWLVAPLISLLVGLRIGLMAGALVLLAGIAGQILYIRAFPLISRWLGYGSVEDTPVRRSTLPTAEPLPRAVLYTANVCPFCPIVRRRLETMQRNMGFELKELDVTFRPDLVRAKGLRSVPVVEVNGRMLVGNATSEQLASLLLGQLPTTNR